MQDRLGEVSQISLCTLRLTERATTVNLLYQGSQPAPRQNTSATCGCRSSNADSLPCHKKAWFIYRIFATVAFAYICIFAALIDIEDVIGLRLGFHHQLAMNCDVFASRLTS